LHNLKRILFFFIFRDDAAIWKLSWSDPVFGELIAIASFKKKVAVFQNKNNKWTEIARH
jgi:hypothetical protein